MLYILELCARANGQVTAARAEGHLEKTNLSKTVPPRKRGFSRRVAGYEPAMVRANVIRSNSCVRIALKLIIACSIPHAVAACQDWASRLFEMMAEDRDHQLADYQMFMEAGAHFLRNIWQWNSSAVSAQLQARVRSRSRSSAAFQE